MSAPDTSSTAVATKILGVTVLSLPLILAAFRYLIDEKGTEEFEGESFGRYVSLFVLGYVLLLAALVSASKHLSNQVNDSIVTSLLFIEAFYILVGGMTISLIARELPDGWQKQYLGNLRIVFAILILILIGSAVLLV